MIASMAELKQKYFPDVLPWHKTKDILPSEIVGEKVFVFFCSPDWGYPIYGTFEKITRKNHVWTIYDQINDEYIVWNKTAPEYWYSVPKIPVE